VYKSFLAFVLIVLSVFIYLWQQNTSTRFAYKLSSLQSEYDKISSENKSLQMKINSIFTLDKMYKVAEEKNLSIPDESSIVYIN
jgi:cell division protein FtsL